MPFYIVLIPAFSDYLPFVKSFSQGRVNQALGKEGVLPFSSFWASNWPAKAPLAGIGLRKSITLSFQEPTHLPKDWAMCIIVIFAVPPGDAFNFIINMVHTALIRLSTST